MEQCAPGSDFVEISNAFNGILKTYFLRNFNELLKDICLLLIYYKDSMSRLIQRLLHENGALKFNLVVESTYVKPVTNETQDRSFKTTNVSVFAGSEVDNKCFQWAILAKFVTQTNADRINHNYFNLLNKFNFTSLSFPTPLKEIKKFEQMNIGVSVNVFGIGSDDKVFPLRVCEKEEKEHFDLLLITNDDKEFHY